MTALLAALLRCVRSCLTLALLRLADGSRFVARLPALGAAHLVLRDYRTMARA